MASRKLLRKEIYYLLDDMIEECCVMCCLNDKFADNDAQRIICKIYDIKDEYIARLNHVEKCATRKETKKVYKTLIDNFLQALVEVHKEIEEALK